MIRKGAVKNVVLAIFLIAFCGCTQQKRETFFPVDNAAGQRQLSPEEKITVKVLEQFFEKWQGTKYRYGGLSSAGVDCSGFTLLTFRELFGLELPRTTGEQAEIGKKVARESLQAGDLVFFKPGIWQRHVGIYLDNNRFIHASTSKGVMLSNLHDYYWQGRYWQARRIGAKP